MRRSFSFSACCLLLFALFGFPALAEGPLHLDFYFSPTCESCHYIREEALPPLIEQYGTDLDITFIDISMAEGLERLETEEARLGRLNNPIPVIVAGDVLIANGDVFVLKKELAAFLQREIGAAQPTATTAATDTPAAVPTKAPTPSAAAKPIHIAYVEKDGCEHCARAQVVLDTLRETYPNMVVAKFNNMRDADLIEAIGEHLDLPPERRLIAPSVYIGQDALIEAEITSAALRQLLDHYAETGAPAFWETLDTGSGEQSIIERFQTMGPLAVVLAALIDGINPCAFATILFFVSYLAISRREKSALLAVGLAFTAGVFVAYLVVGLGAMELLKWIQAFRVVGDILYGLMGLACLVLAGISVHDYLLARQGRLDDMKLNLPEPLRDRIKGRIRANRNAFVGAAFVSGLAVSLLELACTGQVYLPTISFVVSIPSMRAAGIAYLLLYNLVFVVPLLVVLLLAVYGVSATRFQQWFTRHAATAKLIMAILFVVLGALLIAQIVAL